MKKNPLAATFEELGADGSANHVGTVDFKVLHAPSGLISGALLSPEGVLLGQVSITGVDLAAFEPKKVGRPRADEKRLAVLLAWALKYCELGDKRTEADNQAAQFFNYSEGKKVRDIRRDLSKKLGLDVECGIASINDDSSAGPPPCSVLIRRPTYYQIDDKSEIVGIGDLWTASFGCRVESGKAFKVEIPNVEDSDAFAKLKQSGGPIIISVLRPGR